MMQNFWSDNRKLPSWIGSILFHAILALLLLFWFSFSPDQKSAPGERLASGSIVLQSHAESRGGSEGTSSSDADLSATVPEQFSEGSLADLPTTQALAAGPRAEVPAEIASAGNIAEGFQQGGQGGTGVGNGMGTGAVTVPFFGHRGTGTKFVYVLDRSLSMEGAPLRRAKEELIRSFRSLGELHQFNILFYNHAWKPWQPGRKLIFATPEEKENAERFVGSISAIGGTYHFDSMQEAIALRPDVISFLTDGESSDDWTLRFPELERLNSQRGYGAQIHVIQFGSGGLTDPPSRLLQQLADQNRGQYLYIDVKTLK
jgi:hypothetical protein